MDSLYPYKRYALSGIQRQYHLPEYSEVVAVVQPTAKLDTGSLPFRQTLRGLRLNFTHEVSEQKLPNFLSGPYEHRIESVNVGNFYFREGFGGMIGIHTTTVDTPNIITLDRSLSYQQTVNLILNRINDIINENNERPLIPNGLFKFNSNTSIRIRSVGLGDIVDPTNAEIDASERTVNILKEVGIYDITVGSNIFGFKQIPPPVFLLYGPPSDENNANYLTNVPENERSLLGIVNRDKISAIDQSIDSVYYHHGDTRSLSIVPVYENSSTLQLHYNIHIVLRRCH